MSGRRRVVVTGFGAVNAAGSNVADFEQNLRKSASCLTRITAFDAEDFPVRVAGQVTDLRAADHVPRRFLAKTDRFTHLSFVSTDEALADAGLDLAGEDRSRVGVWFGNNTGGWDLCERGFLEYYRDGADVVNPWQATAWFLAAPQGFTTIRYGITGMSKSFSGDRTSGASAIYYGARSIGWGRTDVVLAGGCEAPVTPLSIACHGSNGELSTVADPETAYRPFDHSASGLVLGEGGVTLVLEEAERARARGAASRLDVLGGAHGTAPDRDARAFARVIERALDDAGCRITDIDLVLAEGVARRAGDRFELDALASVAGAHRVAVAAPKSIYGHLFGAGFGTDVLAGAVAVRESFVPPTVGFERGYLPGGLRVHRHATEQTIRTFLVVSHSRYGSCLAMIFRAPE